MSALHVTARDFVRPRFGLRGTEWVGLCLYKMHIQDCDLVQVQSLEWPSGYVGFESIPPRLRFARWLRETGRINE